tara:strand:- start:144 stop:800 length:657 start_codon:yes stop_codon:yes gene_type:complete
MINPPIVPAVIPKSREDVLKFAEKLQFSREYHLDLVDGVFVPTVSWPYSPVGEAMSVKTQLDIYTLEVDLMVANPISTATEWVVAGADMLVFHIETLPLEVFKNFAEHTDVSVGVSAHGATSIEELGEYAKFSDYVQLMGIYEIGAQGQPFDEAIFGKIEWLKQNFPGKTISVDGSVNASTIKSLYDAGVDRFICGSAIVLQDDPEEAHKELLKIING